MEQPFTIVRKSNPLALVKWIVAGMNLLIVLPPILAEYGANKIAGYLYFVLGIVCHQRADRSLYLFGDALLHPKAEIWRHVPFSEIFTFDFRQRFTCSADLGCKFGVCSRCTGLYVGLLLGLLLSEFMIQWKIPKIIPILFLIPLILDGGIQTVAYILAPERGFYESTNPRRLTTGLLFGFGIGYLMVSAVKKTIAN